MQNTTNPKRIGIIVQYCVVVLVRFATTSLAGAAPPAKATKIEAGPFFGRGIGKDGRLAIIAFHAVQGP